MSIKVDLSGQVALVTGAAKGIGEAIARTLAENGANVWFTDIIPLEHWSGAVPDGCHAAHLDVSDESAVDALFNQVQSAAGKLDILINNAGVNTMAHRVNIDQFPKEEWDRIVNVDLTGLFLVSRAGARVMLNNQYGRIVNIASIAGLVPLRLQSPFVAAKAGVVNLTKSMALELGPGGINVNCIAPGSVLTEGTRALFYGEDGKFHGRVADMIAHVPLGRPGTTEEIAHAALFLSARESSYINGAILTVDGGWTAGYHRDF